METIGEVGGKAMRLPRVRFTMRGMMVAVVIFAVACFGGREYWARWLRQNFGNPVRQSRLSVSSGGSDGAVVSTFDRPLPVTIAYNFKIATLKLPPGTTCLLLGAVWLEDRKTGLYVDGYTFDASLTVGGREAANGALTWVPSVLQAGKYFLRDALYYEDPSGELRMMDGGARSYDLVATPPSNPTAPKPGDRQ